MSEVRFNCPNCGDVKRHLYINIQKRLGFCFRCGLRMSPFDVSEFLKHYRYELIPTRNSTEQTKDTYISKLLEESIDADTLGEERYYQVMKYIGKEKIPFEKAKHFKLRFCSEGVIIPLGEGHFQVRRFVKIPKYYTSKGSTKKLFNLPLNSRRIVLVEGVFDAIATDSTALFGHFVTDSQIFEMMWNYDEVVVALDGDVPKSTIIQLLKRLEKYFREVFVKQLPPGKDPYDLCEEFSSIREIPSEVFV